MFAQSKKKKNHRSRNDNLTWSEWAWHDEGRQWYCCALDKNGEPQYQYDTERPPPAPPSAPSEPYVTPRSLPESSSMNPYSSSSVNYSSYHRNPEYTHEREKVDSGSVGDDLSSKFDSISIAPSPAIVQSTWYERGYHGTGNETNDASGDRPGLPHSLSVPTTNYGSFSIAATTSGYPSSYDESARSMTSGSSHQQSFPAYYSSNAGQYSGYEASNTGIQPLNSEVSQPTGHTDDWASGNSSLAPTQPNSDKKEYKKSGMGSNAHGRAKKSNTDREKQSLHSTFKMYPSNQFKVFRVFKVLWSEPLGMASTTMSDITVEETKHGQHAWSKIRRFAIVRTFTGHSQCLPILTYQYQGTTKSGVKSEDHAVIYTGDQKPELLSGEAEMEHRSIQMVPDSHRHKLLPQSRINYAKVYTIEHNLKVEFIGKIAKSFEGRFMTSYDAVSARGGPA